MARCAWVAETGLTLHPNKTQIVDAGQGFDFLGYHFEASFGLPRDKSMKKIKETIRVKTKRNNGRACLQRMPKVNATLRGWFGYFDIVAGLSSGSWTAGYGASP